MPTDRSRLVAIFDMYIIRAVRSYNRAYPPSAEKPAWEPTEDELARLARLDVHRDRYMQAAIDFADLKRAALAAYDGPRGMLYAHRSEVEAPAAVILRGGE